jgi:hypothetical protein
MKKVVALPLVFLLILSFNLFSQQIPGAGKNAVFTTNKAVMQSSVKSMSKIADTYTYSTTTYTFSDLVVFSYFDNSTFLLLSNFGTHIDSVTLNENEYHVFSPGAGVYRVEGSNSFTLLIGDPVSRSVMGYFAVNESGRPLSTRLNTYMPSNSFSGEYFIVFAYSDNTEYTLKNLSTGAVIASGILNRGEHYELSGYNDTFIGVFASKPVSALTYADQGYFIPADNGTFAGTHFYGFSGYIGSWSNRIIITAYNDDTDYLILNSTTGDTIASGTINTGEVEYALVYSDTYWEVSTNNNVTVSNTPYAYTSSGYAYLTRQIDETGMGIGTNFYCPVISGDLNVFSYVDGNMVTVTDMTTATEVLKDTLDANESFYLYSSKTVYHITGTGNLSVVTSASGGYGADFVPLNFSTGLPDFAISADDIIFTPDTESRNYGDPILISATVHNYGFSDAMNVPVRFYDGDPDAGIPIGGFMLAPFIPAGGSYTLHRNWTVPTYPEYHTVYAKIDPHDDIIESNSSNNMAYKFIIANDDLLPPLSTTVDAPATVFHEGDSTQFNEFDITVYLFNTGDTAATNSSVTLHLPEQLSLETPGDSLLVLGNIEEGENTNDMWHVMINSFPTNGAFFYSVLVDADNAPAKLVERMLLVHGPSAIEDDETNPNIPDKLNLLYNYPNPFNPVTTVEYTIEKTSNVLLEIYDITGRKIDTLIRERKNPGRYSFTLNAGNMGTGMYILRLKTDDQHTIRKITLIK